MSTGTQPVYPDDRGDWLTLKQAAAQLGISPRTARRWIREGKLDGELMAGPYGNQYMVPARQINTAQEITDVVKVDRQADATTLAAIIERQNAGIIEAIEAVHVEGREAIQIVADTLLRQNESLQQLATALQQRDAALYTKIDELQRQIEDLQAVDEGNDIADEPEPAVDIWGTSTREEVIAWWANVEARQNAPQGAESDDPPDTQADTHDDTRRPWWRRLWGG